MIRVGILGISGYGGGEALRLVASHPQFELVYASGGSTAGQKLSDRYPGIPKKLANLAIESTDIAALGSGAHRKVDLLIASLPTGESKQLLAQVPGDIKVVDVGSDHRYSAGWTYGLADVWPDKIRGSSRVANPGCFPSAALAAIAPLLAHKLVDLAGGPIIIDAKTGISGAGRGGASDSKFSYAEINEDVAPYGLLKHGHVPEMSATVREITGSGARLVFTPHLVPMTRGIVATCYLAGKADTQACMAAARDFYANRPFVRVVDQPPHSKWAACSNLVFVSYASAGDGTMIAMGAVDNLGKGAAGQAIQNANLMFHLDETMGLEAAPVWP